MSHGRCTNSCSNDPNDCSANCSNQYVACELVLPLSPGFEMHSPRGKQPAREGTAPSMPCAQHDDRGKPRSLQGTSRDSGCTELAGSPRSHSPSRGWRSLRGMTRRLPVGRFDARGMAGLMVLAIPSPQGIRRERRGTGRKGRGRISARRWIEDIRAFPVRIALIGIEGLRFLANPEGWPIREESAALSGLGLIPDSRTWR